MLPSSLKLMIGQKILQAEEQILERVEEEPDIGTRRLAAEVGVFKKGKISISLIFHVV